MGTERAGEAVLLQRAHYLDIRVSDPRSLGEMGPAPKGRTVMSTLDTSPSARHRRLRLAVRSLKRYHRASGDRRAWGDSLDRRRLQRGMTHGARDGLADEQRRASWTTGSSGPY